MFFANNAAPPESPHSHSIPATAAETSRENPWPLAVFTGKLKAYIDRGPAVWVKGEVVEYTQRPGTKMAFFKLRDLNQQVSMSVKCFSSVLPPAEAGFGAGAKLVIHAKPDFYEGNGQLSLYAKEIHTLGIGDLLAQIEALRKKLAGEGLFDPRHKKPLPFMPKKIGLIVGRNAKALHDVVVNAKSRWPIAEFKIHEVAVQGPNCVSEVCAALIALDSDPEVEVIVIARGGGAVEDLLPFSEEQMVRAAFAAKTPLVGAIGHETDCPILDYVVDYRASTPTDAARKIVPDLQEEWHGLTQSRKILNQRFERLILHQQNHLDLLRSHPIIRDPREMINIHSERLDNCRQKLDALINNQLAQQETEIQGLVQTLKAISPLGVMNRGYSIIRQADGRVITSAQELKNGDLLELLMASGSAIAQVKGSNPKSQLLGMGKEE